MKSMTFEDWKKNNPIKCKCCKEVLPTDTFENYAKDIHKITNVDGARLRGLYCTGCVDFAQAQIMNESFVEVYKGNQIYRKQGGYTPYWGCNYYFDTVEDCRLRIDHNHLSIVDLIMMSNKSPFQSLSIGEKEG